MPPKRSSEEKLLRRGKWTYIVALLLIAALNVGSLAVFDRIVHKQRSNALLINVSGRQRMLSQRIVKVALERAVHSKRRSDVVAQRILRESVARLDAVNQGLMHGSAELKLPVPSQAMLEVYTGTKWHLAEQMERFLGHAHRVAEQTAAQTSFDDPDLLAMEEEARTPLLNALDAAVVADQEHSEEGITHLRMLLGGLTTGLLLILLAEALLLFRPLFQRLHSEQERLLEVGRTDALTGCLNRRAFEERGRLLFERARRSQEPMSLLSLDLDHFKAVNDRYGHAVGDLALQTFVRTVTTQMRSLDLLFRMGGEEFVLMLPMAGESQIGAIAERYRRAIEAVPVDTGSTRIALTASVGAAWLEAGDAGLEALMERADVALYAAKRRGRNRVELAAGPGMELMQGARLEFGAVSVR